MRISQGLIWEIAIVIIAMPASILLNRSLGSEDRGILAAIMLIPGLVSTIIGCQWDKLIRSKILSGVNTPEEVWWITKRYLLVMSLVGIVLSCFLIEIQESLGSQDKKLAFITSIFLVPLPLLSLFLAALINASRKLKEYYLLRIIGPTVFLSAVIIFCIGKFTIEKALLSHILLWISTVILGIYFLKSNFRKNYSNNIKLKINELVNGFPAYVLETVSVQLDIWLLATYCGYAVTGAYVAFKIFDVPMRTIAFAIINVGGTNINLENKNEVIKYLTRSTLIMTFLGLLFLVLTIIFGKKLILLAIGNSYQEMVWMLVFIVIGSILFNISSILMNFILIQGKASQYLQVQITDAVLKITLLIFGCILFEALGILLALIISSIIKIIILKIIVVDRNGKQLIGFNLREYFDRNKYL